VPFQTAFDAVVGEEGDFVDDPNDAGGATRFGITERVARNFGYTGDMRELPLDTAQAIYKAQYWDALRLDDIDSLSDQVSLEMFDTGVNTGISHAAIWLQRVLNAFNKDGTIYQDVMCDGQVGSQTVNALKEYLWYRHDDGVEVLLKAMVCLKGEYYISIEEHDRQHDSTFAYGWIKNRIHL
jgi:lysozyme family protein